VEKVPAQNSRSVGGTGAHVNYKRVAIGVERDVEATAVASTTLEWIPVEGGRAARLSVTSPEAPALRVALNMLDVPTDVEMVFFGSMAPDKLFGPYRVGDIADRSEAWWSPFTPGETLNVEFFEPRRAREAGSDPRIASVAHLFSDPSKRAIGKRGQDIGNSGPCNIDVPCSSLHSSTAFLNAASSVAQMVFNDTRFTYLCTGTLVNDTDSATQKPWFFSANHCFDDETAPRTPAQMQTVANTLTTLWFFEASACGSSQVNPNWQQVGGGATYIYSNAQSDALFIRLNNAPPAGAFYSGWDANPIAVGSSDIDLSHPQGDLKKIAQGSVVGFSRWDSTSNANQYIRSQWSSGTTEGGSSGSALFTLSGSQYVVRGGLRGGSASCDTPTGTDLFSRFDQVYPSISQYLSAAQTITPIANVSSLWWIPSESGWGLNIVHHNGTNIVFATWYTYGQDGKRTWLVMTDGRWSTSRIFSGTLYQSSGPAFDAPFDPNQVTLVAVGTGTLTLSDANNGTWSWTANGLAGTKNVTRFAF
jgi:lysyl endopeptidase